LEIVKLCCGLRQEILDPETALALHRDDAGTFSNTGSIGGVTEATIKAVVETTEGCACRCHFGNETALVYPWQIVIEAR